MLAEAGAFEQLREQAEIVRRSRARLAGAGSLLFGIRWVMRHQNVDVGARFLEEAVKLDPENEGAFFT